MYSLWQIKGRCYLEQLANNREEDDERDNDITLL
jgi:hypothetical protein